MPLVESQPDALANIYARSLFELAAAEGPQTAETVLGELEDVLELARQDPRFSEFLSSLVVSQASRDRSLETIFTGRASPLTLRFLRVLNAKGRLAHLPAVTAAFTQQVQNAFGRVEIDVFTAEPLNDAEKGVLRQRLSSRLGKDVIVHAYTEPAMLGGIKLRIGDQLIDDSLATHLRRMKDALIAGGAPRIRSEADRLMN